MKRSDFLATLFAIPFFKPKKKVYESVTLQNSQAAKIEFYKKIWFNAQIIVNGEDLYIKPNNNRKG